MEFACFLIVCISNSELIDITELRYHWKLMEAELHWLQFLKWLVDHVEHVWVLEAVINIVTRQDFKPLWVFVLGIGHLILVVDHIIFESGNLILMLLWNLIHFNVLNLNLFLQSGSKFSDVILFWVENFHWIASSKFCLVSLYTRWRFDAHSLLEFSDFFLSS